MLIGLYLLKRFLFPDLNIVITLASFILSGKIPDSKERYMYKGVCCVPNGFFEEFSRNIVMSHASFGFERVACIYEF